jgi:hypothetical protein
MRKFLFVLFAAMAFVVSAQAPARAQVSDQEAAWLSKVMAWSADYNDLAGRLFDPLHTLPETPATFASKKEIKAWVKEARAWVASARVTVAAVRAEAAALPRVPTGGPVSLAGLFEAQQDALPSIIDSIDGVIVQYEAGANAIEQGDQEAMLKQQELMVDAARLVMQRVVDQSRINAASMTPTHPQRHLFLSSIASYDGLFAQLDVAREAVRGEPASRAAAVTKIRAAASTMRLEIAAGRKRAVELERSLSTPGVLGAKQETLRANMLAATRTYTAQFDNEETMAQSLDRLVQSLETTASYAAIQDTLLSEMETIANLDVIRVELVRNRVDLMQRQ